LLAVPPAVFVFVGGLEQLAFRVRAVLSRSPTTHGLAIAVTPRWTRP